MNHARLGWVLGAASSVGAVFLLLAGSDLPPPLAFLWVVVAAVPIMALVRALVPPLLRLRDRSTRGRAVLVAIGVGSGVGVALAAILVLLGSGEPTAPTATALEVAIFIAVAGAAGTGAATVIAVTAIVSASRARPTVAFLVAVAPGAFVSVAAVGVIAARLSD